MDRRTKPSGAAAAAPVRVRRSPAAMAALKRAMLERARLIHREEGLAALSMRRMAQEAGLSTMALYSYFPSKQALLEELWQEVFEGLLAQLLPASTGRRLPLGVLESHVRSFLDFWEQRPDQFRMIYMSAQQSAGEGAVAIERRPVYQQVVNLTRERVAACWRGASEPSEAEVARLAALVVAKQLGYLLLAVGLARYPLPDRDVLRESLVADIVAAVAAP